MWAHFSNRCRFCCCLLAALRRRFPTSCVEFESRSKRTITPRSWVDPWPRTAHVDVETFLTRYRYESMRTFTMKTIEITTAPSRHTGQTVVWSALNGPQRRTENDEKRNSMAPRLYGVCAVSALRLRTLAPPPTDLRVTSSLHIRILPTRSRRVARAAVYARTEALDLPPRSHRAAVPSARTRELAKWRWTSVVGLRCRGWGREGGGGMKRQGEEEEVELVVTPTKSVPGPAQPQFVDCND